MLVQSIEQVWGAEVDAQEHEEPDLFPDENGDLEVFVDVDTIFVGMEFIDRVEFKKHLRGYAIQKGFQYKFKPNAKERIRVNCKNRAANAEFVPAFLYDKLKNGDPMPLPYNLKDQFHTTHNTSFPYHVDWRERTVVLEKLNDNYDESYRMVPAFCDLVENTNPGSVINYTYGSVDHCFESTMVAFKSPLQGFRDGCRSVIGLDPCHLLAKHGGCLMAATSLDSQNGIVPLAIMVCRNEIWENWHMFLKH